MIRVDELIGELQQLTSYPSSTAFRAPVTGKIPWLVGSTILSGLPMLRNDLKGRRETKSSLVDKESVISQMVVGILNQDIEEYPTKKLIRARKLKTTLSVVPMYLPDGLVPKN
jgi:hypothetical protein